MAERGAEKLLGVLTALRVRTNDYDVLFTDRRLVAVRVGSSSVSQIASGMAGLEDLGAKHRGREEAYAARSMEELLAAHPKNFEVPYESIERARFNAGISMLYAPYIRIHARDRKLTMILLSSLARKDRAQVRQTKDLLIRALGRKATFKHI